jgi:ABC-type phosphate/phosphonate transport system substrate-binding protein
MALWSAPTRAADDLVLAVQPILDEAQTRKVFQPLCDYLGKATGNRCSLYTATHFYPYWEVVRHGKDFNLALDAAHFTDYRVRKLNFEVLAKIPDTVSYTLVTRNTELVVEPAELVGKRVATLGIPSIGAVRLNAMFPNPSRQPLAVEVADAEQGLRQLLDGQVYAAILPTPIVSQRMAQGAPLAVVLTTDPIPHIALSAAPSLSATTRRMLREALSNAHLNEAGKAMLKQIGFERFDPASSAIYADQGRVLREYWGY